MRILIIASSERCRRLPVFRFGGLRIGFLQCHCVLQQQFGGRRHQRVQPLPDVGFGQYSHELIDRLAVQKRHDHRDALDLKRRGELLFFVRIDLGQHELAGILVRQLFQERCELPAQSAPGCPEVDDDQRLLRLVDHVGLKRGRLDVDDEGRRTSHAQYLSDSTAGNQAEQTPPSAV